MITSYQYSNKNETLFSFLAGFFFISWLTSSADCLWLGFSRKNLLSALKTFVKNDFVFSFFGILTQSLNYYVVTFSTHVRHFDSLCFRDLPVNQFYFNFLHGLGLTGSQPLSELKFWHVYC